MSSAETEYVVAAGCCAQVLWIKSQLADYDVLYDKVPIFCDNTSAITISNNPVLHSRTKYIDIRYHFIRDHILKGGIELHFIPTDLHLADIFTKPLAEPSYTRLVAELVEVEEETKTITFSLSWWDKPMSFTQDEFISAIGLPICKDVVPLPPKETLRAGLATLENCISNDLTLVKPHTITAASFQKPLAYEVALTSHMLKPVTQPKVPTDLKKKKKRILPSSKPKSPYKVRVILPKKQVTKTQHAKVIVVIADATKSLVSSELAEEQVNQPSAAEAEKLMDEVDKLKEAAQEKPESPYDTESEIKIIKSYQVNIVSGNEEREASDSGLRSMPDDDLVSLSGFDSQPSTDHDSKEGTATFHASVDMTAQSDPLGHLHEELVILNIKIDQLESSISKKVVEDMNSFDSIKFSVSESIADELPQKELSKFLHSKMRKSIRLRVHTGMKEVCHKLSACTSSVATNSQHVQDLRLMFHEMVSLLSAAEVFQKANTEGEK
ncbi:hypothetical protein Tco_1002229 [Tanacetum coccineum]|uniref:Retrovirus-related Pol polyprotein from transposon TNT 1-94 n=1 Tax=Tanacetum coccineum TaxID=301880 RepID=A0ABQ5F5Q2_9ASTR